MENKKIKNTQIEHTEKTENTESIGTIKLPKEFKDRMKKLLKDEWESFEYSYMNNRYQSLRINRLKKGAEEESCNEILKSAGIEHIDKVEWADDGYYYENTSYPGKHPYHEAGLYYIQEPSAMSAASLLKPLPGELVLDLCAAPGGKSTQLAAYMNQEGLLVSNEIHPARCKILSQNIERMGIANAIVTNEDSGSLSEKFPEFFDKILVDAPCSGEGMFRKNPQAIEEWSVSNVMLCAKRQAEILDNAAAMLKRGGVMVYSTCTFSPEENEDTIEAFAKRHTEFSVEKQIRLFPHKHRGEGHFAALLKKAPLSADIAVQSQHVNTGINTGNISQNSGYSKHISFDDRYNRKNGKNKKNPNIWPDKKQLTVLKEFTSKALSTEAEQYILSGTLVLFGEQLYLLPNTAPPLNGIKVLRAGLHIGEFKKDRFEPSHALALFLGKDDVKNIENIILPDSRAEKYLKGETIETNISKGWCLVCVDGYSIGWGKAAGGQLKNHYPKGLRK